MALNQEDVEFILQSAEAVHRQMETAGSHAGNVQEYLSYIASDKSKPSEIQTAQLNLAKAYLRQGIEKAEFLRQHLGELEQRTKDCLL